MLSLLPNGSNSRWRGLALCGVLLLAASSVLNSQETPSAGQTSETDRVQIAQEAVGRLSGPVNIHTPEWSQLPEPEFVTLLIEAIDGGQFSDEAAGERRAKELALLRLRRHPDIVYPLFIKMLHDPELQNRYILRIRALPQAYHEIALRDVRMIVDEGTMAPETEDLLHTVFFGTVRDPNNPWAIFARERFKDVSVPLRVRISAGAYWYSCEDPDLVLKDASEADTTSRGAAIGALSRFIRYFQTNSVLGSEENLIVARDLVSQGLKAEAPEVRKWAVYASFYVAFQFGYQPIVTNVGKPDMEMIERIENAQDAERDPEIRAIFDEVLEGIEKVPKGS